MVVPSVLLVIVVSLFFTFNPSWSPAAGLLTEIVISKKIGATKVATARAEVL
jgi:hypothetical protein